MVQSNGHKLESLVLLRSIAVMIVCFCHFAKPLSEGFLFSGAFLALNTFGKYGVEMFFVISGFVIPLSMEKGKYAIGDYFTFLYKRLVRLHPAFLAAIALTLIITYFSFKSRHEAFPETTTSILRSIFLYGNLGFNPVFWTLFIEAQFYLFIGLFFIVLKKHTNLSLFVIIPALLILSQTPFANNIRLLKHLDFFLIGTVGFLLHIDHGQKQVNYLVLILLIAFSFFFCDIPGIVDSVPAAIASLFAILVILFYNGKIVVPAKFIGKISYSLYLTHFPVGTKFIRLFMRFVNPAYGWILFFAAFAAAIPVAWLFNRFIETPSENYSQKIKYKAAINPSIQ